MNNDLYHWHAERMVELEMQEIRRELAQESLLREAGISRASLLARAMGALRNLLVGRKESLHTHDSGASHTNQPANEKLSQSKERNFSSQ